MKGMVTCTAGALERTHPYLKPDRKAVFGVAAEFIPKSERDIVCVDGLVFRSGSTAYARHMRWHRHNRKKCDCLSNR
jgi:hypothetical protein